MMTDLKKIDQRLNSGKLDQNPKFSVVPSGPIRSSLIAVVILITHRTSTACCPRWAADQQQQSLRSHPDLLQQNLHFNKIPSESHARGLTHLNLFTYPMSMPSSLFQLKHCARLVWLSG